MGNTSPIGIAGMSGGKGRQRRGIFVIISPLEGEMKVRGKNDYEVFLRNSSESRLKNSPL